MKGPGGVRVGYEGASAWTWSRRKKLLGMSTDAEPSLLYVAARWFARHLYLPLVYIGMFVVPVCLYDDSRWAFVRYNYVFVFTGYFQFVSRITQVLEYSTWHQSTPSGTLVVSIPCRRCC